MKDILVVLDNGATTENRLAAAVELADGFDAHLTGLYIREKPDPLLYENPLNTLLLENALSEIEADVERMTSVFFDQVQHRMARSSLLSDAEVHDHTQLAMVNDLIVAGQAHPETTPHDQSQHTLDIIMRPGRPVLLIPYIGYKPGIGTNIIVAWDGSKEATRAVHDAMPFLRRAETVKIVSLHRKEQKSPENAVTGADLAVHLARHDISVSTDDVVRNNMPVAETLLSLAADDGADMLVMGAYGHSRLREYAFGGTTRTLLNSMTLPVLMAH